MAWDPDQYLRYAEPRLRPALDLLARIDSTGISTICDLGCGTGNVTRWLARRWPDADITGIDSSAQMLAHARRDQPDLRWEQADIARWHAPNRFDLIFSNAALHWLPEHAALFPRLISSLRPGGVLAVQMPNNFSAPSHTAIAETVLNGPWREALRPFVQAAPVAAPAEYFTMLSPYADVIDIWQTEYLHVLEGGDPVKEWTKGTWLKRFLDALPAEEAAAFEADYARRVGTAYPMQADGRTLFPFRRVFVVAVRCRTE